MDRQPLILVRPLHILHWETTNHKQQYSEVEQIIHEYVKLMVNLLEVKKDDIIYEQTLIKDILKYED